jgi:hypothetical protein
MAGCNVNFYKQYNPFFRGNRTRIQRRKILGESEIEGVKRGDGDGEGEACTVHYTKPQAKQRRGRKFE